MLRKTSNFSVTLIVFVGALQGFSGTAHSIDPVQVGLDNARWATHQVIQNMLEEQIRDEKKKEAERSRAQSAPAGKISRPAEINSSTSNSQTSISTSRSVTSKTSGRVSDAMRAAFVRVFETNPGDDFIEAYSEILFMKQRHIEKTLGLPRDDMAGAFASLVYGSYLAVTMQNSKDAVFAKLVPQMREALNADKRIDSLSEGAKRAFFELAVVQGHTLALAVGQSDPENRKRFQDLGRQFIKEAFPGKRAEDLRISPEEGLTFVR